ncbi:hypothetical protein [Streptomyces sp. TP-A0356]|uniref:hypothetical protein n=1 Tax=Streptomyces sp. TP-A0356 TaxID=1359208 RepID=UPI0006E40743|nr:hypothetical protein [Streptomyces sp. TP-A0356]
MVTVVATLLYLMFSTDSDHSVHREALFGSLFFDQKEKAGGAIGVTMGVANPTALIVMFLVFAVVLTFTQITYRGLKQRREQLIKEMAGN